MSCGQHPATLTTYCTPFNGKTFSENLFLLLSTKTRYIISARNNCRAKWSLNFSARIVSNTLRSVIHQVGLLCATQLCVVMSRSWKPCWQRKGILMTKQWHFDKKFCESWVFGGMRKAWKKQASSLRGTWILWNGASWVWFWTLMGRS